MKLNIQPISQRDSRWANEKLDSSTVLTIGSDGCALACVTMVCNYFGHEITPAQLNTELTKKNGFYQCRLIWGAVTEIYPDVLVDWDNYIDCADIPAPLEKIDALLANNRPVLVKVDYSPSQGLQEHWVLIVGKDGDYLINDPWTGETYWFAAKIGDPKTKIYKIVTYNGKIPETCEDTMATLRAENEKLRGQLASEIQLVSELRNQMARLEQDAQGREAELKELHDRNRALEIDNSNKDSQIKTLQGDIDVLATKYNGLLGDYTALQAQKVEDFSVSELLRAAIRKIFGKNA